VVGAVGWMLEVQSGSPVVGKVFGHLARSASSSFADIAGHSCVEGIATNNVMNVSGRECAWLGSRIKALESQRGAWETKPSLDRGDEREGCGERLHLRTGCGVDGSRGAGLVIRVKPERSNAVASLPLLVHDFGCELESYTNPSLVRPSAPYCKLYFLDIQRPRSEQTDGD
jgi:hypothetical protein